MKIRKYILILFFLLIKNSQGYSQDISDKIDLLMNNYYRNDQFNGVVLVAKNGKIIYKKAFGVADRDWNLPVTTDTKFKIASLSKSFTALAIMQLVSEGKIRLNGTIKEYIPDYSGKLGDSITIHQLLTHTSGIRSSLDPEEEIIKQRLHHDLREYLKYAEASDLLFKPGNRFGYSNFGYNILAYIIQMITGKSYNVVLKEKIFDPAGMKSTKQYDNILVEEKLAKGYEYNLLYGYRNADYVDASLTVGPGGLLSTVEDLFLFDRSLYSQKLLSDEYLKSIFKPYQPGKYGYGWFISKRIFPGLPDSITIADHSGSIDGFGSYMARILTDSSFVVVLKNQRSDTYIHPGYAPDIGNQIISIIYGSDPEPTRKSIASHIAYIIGNNGIDSALTAYEKIEKTQPDQYNLEESELNKLGIELFLRYRLWDEALKIFEINMLKYPESYNVYDSYAYVLMKEGKYSDAIRYYKKGLEVLEKFPGCNNIEMVKGEVKMAKIYIKEMEEKLKISDMNH
jgi:CubicO group peptidase (beta-lactamase class C family)